MNKEVETAKLRVIALEKLFNNDVINSDKLNESSSLLLENLITFPEVLSRIFELLQKQYRINFTNGIYNILSRYFTEKNPQLSDQSKKEIANSLIVSVNAHLPQSLSKIDRNILEFLINSSKVGSFFTDFFEYETKYLSNYNVVSFFMFIVYHSGEKQILNKVLAYHTPKFLFNTYSLGSLYALSHGMINELSMSAKTIHAIIKASSDTEVFSSLIPVYFKIFEMMHNEITLKDISSSLSLLFKNTSDYLIVDDFVRYVTEQADGEQVLTPFSQEIIDVYLRSILEHANINDGVDIRYERHIYVPAIESLLQILNLFNIAINTILQSSLVSYPTSVIILLIYACKDDTSILNDNVFKKLTEATASNCDICFLTILSAYVLFSDIDSPCAVKILTDALVEGLDIVVEFLNNENANIDVVLPSIIQSFNEGKDNKIYMDTLISLLNSSSNHVNSEEIYYDDSTCASDSMFENICGIPRANSEIDDLYFLRGEVTFQTKLFCTVITSDRADFMQLIPLAATLISPQFSQQIATGIKNQKKKRSKFELVATYSNSVSSIDRPTLASLAYTFLELSPGPGMLFAAVSLQRLPTQNIMDIMGKLTQYATTHPDYFAKSVALLAHSHPNTAINFLENFIYETYSRKKILFFFKFGDSNDSIAISLFKTIGYCSTFIEMKNFINEFLSFATKFMNKYLIGISKNQNLCSAQLFAIKRLSNKLAQYQNSHSDHTFPFKDFLMDFVRTYFIETSQKFVQNECDSTMICTVLNTLSSLIPIKLIKPSENQERIVQMLAGLLKCSSQADFDSILTAGSQYLLILIESNPTLNVFYTITNSIFQLVIRNPVIIDLIEKISSFYSKIIVESASTHYEEFMSETSQMLSFILPYLTIKEYFEKAKNIVYSICTIQGNIRNVMFKLPLSIKPSLPETNDDDLTSSTQKMCSFVSNNFYTSQIFDLIIALLTHIEDPSVNYGVSLCVQSLLTERGAEEFRYDSEIVTRLLSGMKSSCRIVDDEVKYVHKDTYNTIIACFKVLVNLRFYTIMSTICSFHPEEVYMHDILSTALNNEGCDLILIKYISETLETDEYIISSALPLLSKTLQDSPNEYFTKIFNGIVKINNDPDSPLMNALFDDNGYGLKGVDLWIKRFESLNETRPLVVALILETIPDIDIRLCLDIFLAIAFASVECCSASLSRFFSADVVYEEKYVDMLEKIVCKHPFSVIKQSIELVIDYLISCFHKSVHVLRELPNSIDDDSLQHMWLKLSEKAVGKFDYYLEFYYDMMQHISPKAIEAIIPELIVRSRDTKSASIMSSIIQKLNQQQSNKVDIISIILKSPIFDTNYFLEYFIRCVQEKIHVTEAIAAISILCERIAPENIESINDVIDESISQNLIDNYVVFSVIQDIIF